MDAMDRQGLSPHFYLGASPPQRESGCSTGSHPCNDIGASYCCSDDTYCLLNATWAAVCCQIGSQCGSACAESEYLCNVTTMAAAATTSTVVPACCPRACTATSMYGCPASLGGGCCSYGEQCASGSQCIATATATTGSGLSGSTVLVTELPAGCTAGQVGCSDGGCCNTGYTCTEVSSTGFCAPQTSQPTASADSGAAQSGGLSEGAKAGIGAGVGVAGLLVIATATWFCIARTRRGGTTRGPEGSEPDEDGPARSGGRGPRLAAPPPMAMSESGTSDYYDNPSRDTPRRGLTTEYFGPDAVAGPYTHPAHDASPGTTPGRERGVPVEPHCPDDVTAAVEIDSRIRDVANTTDAGSPGQHSQALSSGSLGPLLPHPAPPAIAGRCELYGSEMPSPSPPWTVTPSPPEDRNQPRREAGR